MKTASTFYSAGCDPTVWGFNSAINDGYPFLTANYSPPIIYVKADAAGSNNGTNWTDAYSSLQTALDNAGEGHQIWVAEGTYKPTVEVGGTGDRYKTFQLKEKVKMYGGFAGNETGTDVSCRDVARRASTIGGGTVLSGDIGVTGIVTDNCYHVFYLPAGLNLCEQTVLDDFSITGGYADGSNPHNYGAGMFIQGSSPTLRHITFRNNIATYGGGIYIRECSPTLENCLFYSNKGGNGGAIETRQAESTMTNCTFVLNKANATSGHGGAINSYLNSNLILNNCIVWGNISKTANQIYISGGGTTTLNYSCYANGENDVLTAVSGTDMFTATNNNLTSDPKFVNMSGYDFRLYGNSPCVNTGSNSYNTLSADIRGEARTQNTVIDMGAFEWTNDTDPETDIATGIDNANGRDVAHYVSTETGINVYPNPVRHQLRIANYELCEGNYSITDLSGRIVIGKRIDNQCIDVSSLPAGMYIIHIEGKTGKFVKEL
ncbi:hypothetical protein MASR2M117_09460 [Paludibacter sp.]